MDLSYQLPETVSRVPKLVTRVKVDKRLKIHHILLLVATTIAIAEAILLEEKPAHVPIEAA